MFKWWDEFQQGKELGRRYFIVVFCISCLLLVIFTSAVYKQSINVEQVNADVTQSYEVLRKIRRVLTSVLNIETGQRGYLLTGSKFFLEPYTRSIQTLDSEIKSLRYEVRKNPKHVEFVNSLEVLIDEEVETISEQVEIFQKRGAWALNLEKLKASKEGIDRVREHIDTFLKEELKILAESQRIAKQKTKAYFITLFSGAALAIGGLVLANIIILRLLSRARETEAELRHFEESYQLLMSGVRDGIFDLYPELNLTHFSPSYKGLLGHSSSEIQSMPDPFKELIHEEDYGFFYNELQRFIRNESEEFSIVHRMKHKDGQYRWMLARAVSVKDAAGKVKRVVGTHTDITSQKAYEEQLKQMNMELEGFTYIASHDLRAPLVNLKGFSTEMQQSIKSAAPALEKAKERLDTKDSELLIRSFEQDIPEALGFIQASVEKMDKLTTAILDLSRIGRRQYRTERVDTNAIVKRCLDALAYEIIEREVAVEVESLPVLTTDALAFEQVVSNLLDNAVKYLSPERKGHISIKARLMPGEVMFIIADNGRGIAESDRSRVFDIFRRASNSGDVRGIGMGMAYVQATVRKLGGRIWFDSTLNQGTSFYFTHPLVHTSGESL
ncbi:MAG: hypothetical protein C0436_01095 [Alphaproteobacteria bacterium]|nr:hypothetical protein [Alphaproteobacteria bacterium]